MFNKELYLVRHGQASFGAANYDQLSSLGVQQSTWLGEYFAQRQIRFDSIFTGTMQRHRQTAQAIQVAMGDSQARHEHSGLNEYDFSALHDTVASHQEFPRTPTDEEKIAFYRQLKKALHLWASDRLNTNMPETWAQFKARIHTGLLAATDCSAQRILIISSGGPLGIAVQHALGAPDAAAVESSLLVRNACFCHYYVTGDGLRLSSFNAIPHLDQPDRLTAITYA
ncbi:MAG: histidine phosphatase family protein [Rhodocyclaceae bacterium]|jgi:broad specificity phosphatase PhoE|nr:histidine phosphatase family protein [Rhodocyclaceae bacterium]